ncbi:MAG TPA: helix-turn-helix domain-containing protein [Thermoanaerobaculia bacterium]|nr:helix-turn-helix domain-containing protein [Thermoanaerobaculia bacterium]
MRSDLFGRPLAARTLGPYTLSLSRYERDSQIPPHAHDAAFATVVLDGGYRETVSHETRHCAPHSIVVHAPGERHADAFVRRTTCLSIHGAAFDRSAHLATPAVAAMAIKLRGEFRTPDELSPMVVEALMLELFVASARHRDSGTAPLWLRDVRATIDERFREPLTLSMLAADADVHAAHLARTFRRHYGTTVGELLRERRVAYAKQRLASRAPLSEIALDAGFADQSHFTRTFRKSTGMTPTAFQQITRVQDV